MFFKILLIVVVCLIVGFVIAITIYRNRKVAPVKKSECYENIIQLDGDTLNTEVEYYFDYVLKKFDKVSIFIIHRRKYDVLRVNDKCYVLSGHDASSMLQGYYVFNRKSHSVYISKMYYNCVEAKAMDVNDGMAEVSKFTVFNPLFEHMRMSLFVVTVLNGDNDYESSLAAMKCIRSDLNQSFMIMGDWGCQNWEFLRSKIFPAGVHSSGRYNVPTRYLSGGKISSPHGCIISQGGITGWFELDINYASLLYTKNQLYWKLKYVKGVMKNEFCITDESLKLGGVLNVIDTKDNLMLDKTVPKIEMIDGPIDVKECKFMKDPKNILLNDLFKYILGKL